MVSGVLRPGEAEVVQVEVQVEVRVVVPLEVPLAGAAGAEDPDDLGVLCAAEEEEEGLSFVRA